MHSFSHKHIVKSVDFTADTTSLVTGGNDKLLRLFDLNNYASEAKVISGHTGNIKKAIFVDDGRRIMSISEDKTLRVWDAQSGAEVSSLKLNNNPNSLELSRDGEWIVLAHGTFVDIYRVADMEKLNSFNLNTPVSAASIHPNKSVFVCGGENFTLYKYNIADGKELESVKGHFGPVHCIQFSPDGEVYASGSEDGTLRLWQNSIGKTYGLWKSMVAANEDSASNLAPSPSANVNNTNE